MIELKSLIKREEDSLTFLSVDIKYEKNEEAEFCSYSLNRSEFNRNYLLSEIGKDEC